MPHTPCLPKGESPSLGSIHSMIPCAVVQDSQIPVLPALLLPNSGALSTLSREPCPETLYIYLGSCMCDYGSFLYVLYSNGGKLAQNLHLLFTCSQSWKLSWRSFAMGEEKWFVHSHSDA